MKITRLPVLVCLLAIATGAFAQAWPAKLIAQGAVPQASTPKELQALIE